MRTMLFVALVAAFAFGSSCGSSSSSANSCQAYYEQNVPGITPTEQQFCLTATGKVAGNCCTNNSQCISGVCCGWNQTCGTRESCECVGP